jgi:DNA (cytosine-5)-methyltransferase 1
MEGIGGFGLAAERIGVEAVAYSEIDPACSKLLAARWPGAKPLGDITAITEEALHALGSVDLVTAGWPCQDLSVAGRRAGLAGARSGLWREVARILGVLRPRWFVGENVPGLLSSKGGEDMGTVLWQLGELGYGWAYRVLDARYFGVAQRRRRVLIVGCLGDPARASEVLLEPQGGEWHPAASGEARPGVAASLTSGSHPSSNAPGRHAEDDVNLVTHALAAHGQRQDASVETFIHVAHTLTAAGRWSTTEDGRGRGTPLVVCPTLEGGQNRTGGDRPPGTTVDTAETLVVFNPYRTLEKDGSVSSGFAERPVVDALHGPTGNKEPLIVDTGSVAVAFTEGAHGVTENPTSDPLQGGGGKPGQGYQAVREGSAVRRLTPVECERLQGFPDGWTEGFSDSTRYRMLGNAICVPVAEWVLRRLADNPPGSRDPQTHREEQT